ASVSSVTLPGVASPRYQPGRSSMEKATRRSSASCAGAMPALSQRAIAAATSEPRLLCERMLSPQLAGCCRSPGGFAADDGGAVRALVGRCPLSTALSARGANRRGDGSVGAGTLAVVSKPPPPPALFSVMNQVL